MNLKATSYEAVGAIESEASARLLIRFCPGMRKKPSRLLDITIDGAPLVLNPCVNGEADTSKIMIIVSLGHIQNSLDSALTIFPNTSFEAMSIRGGNGMTERKTVRASILRPRSSLRTQKRGQRCSILRDIRHATDQVSSSSNLPQNNRETKKY